MFDFFSRFFQREGSSTTAKERLRLVLLSDHLALSPDTVEALKRELVEVISRYVKIDPKLCDVSFEQQASTVAMHANIPILGMLNDRPPVAPPVLLPPSQVNATSPLPPDERPYLDDIHTEVRKGTKMSSNIKPDEADGTETGTGAHASTSELGEDKRDADRRKAAANS